MIFLNTDAAVKHSDRRMVEGKVFIPAGLAAVITIVGLKRRIIDAARVDVGSVQEAELRAVRFGLILAASNPATVRLDEVRTDSKFVASVLTGKTPTSHIDDKLQGLIAGIREALVFAGNPEVVHVPREQNDAADKAAGAALRRMQ